MSRRYAFDANEHQYLDTQYGEVLPHITGMLQRTGWVDSDWYTEESKIRGGAVHRLTADYDLGAIEDADLPKVVSAYKGWLLAHVAMCRIIRPTWLRVEQAIIHERYRFGGRPDRLGVIYGAKAIPEVKSGGYEKAHGVQTALQAILMSQEDGLPPEAYVRYGWYLQKNGKFRLHEFPDTSKDMAEAYRIIRVCCEVAA